MPASHPSPVLAVAPLAPVPSPPPIEDPVPASVLAVIELYADQLAKVAFPEIDASSLRKQAEELRGEAKAVARAREQLELARASFATRMTALTDTAARAVAYARIYSDAHPDRVALATAIAQLATPTVAPAAASGPTLTANGKRRGRPPKRSAELFDAAGADGAEDDKSPENDKTDVPEPEGGEASA